MSPMGKKNIKIFEKRSQFLRLEFLRKTRIVV